MLVSALTSLSTDSRASKLHLRAKDFMETSRAAPLAVAGPCSTSRLSKQWQEKMRFDAPLAIRNLLHAAIHGARDDLHRQIPILFDYANTLPCPIIDAATTRWSKFKKVPEDWTVEKADVLENFHAHMHLNHAIHSSCTNEVVEILREAIRYRREKATRHHYPGYTAWADGMEELWSQVTGEASLEVTHINRADTSSAKEFLAVLRKSDCILGILLRVAKSCTTLLFFFPN